MSLNKIGGSLWNAHNKNAAEQIKKKIPLFNTHNNTMEDERQMMERLLPSTATRSLQENKYTSNLINKSTTNKDDGSTTLLSSMAARLTGLEKSHRQMRSELVQKEKEALEWKRKYQALVEATEDDGAAERSIKKAQELFTANSFLKSQVHEMESFLQDYGLIWVGANDTNSNDRTATTTTTTTTTTTDTNLAQDIGARIDFHQLFRRFDELNHLAGDGKAKISKDGKNARFNFDAKKLSISVYKDGLFIKRGPFRSFSDEKTQRFVSDVLDGYFPPEFEKDYPDGIIFTVTDCTKEIYATTIEGTAESNFTAFGGQGNIIGGQQTQPMSRDEFLSNLPEKMISKGRVINIRDSIASKLDGIDETDAISKQEGKLNEIGVQANGEKEDTLSMTIGKTPALSMLKRSATLGELNADREVTTLRIKMPGGKSLLLKMFFDDKIEDLRKYVTDNMNGSDEFDIRASYPSRMFRDDDLTLVEAGLTPNAALIVQKIKPRK
tara:strand:+ start:894 stop:2381 length:1488 start_codon:yes stop_codon:yes gene_type:complete